MDKDLKKRLESLSDADAKEAAEILEPSCEIWMQL